MTCVNNFIGLAGCKKLPAGIVGGNLMTTDAVITKTAAKTIAGWAAINAAATPAAIKGIALNFDLGVEFEGGENELTSSNTKSTVLTDVSNLRLMGYAEMSEDDYKQFYPMQGQLFRLPLLDANGNWLATNKNATNLTGFLVKFWVNKYLPKHGADRAQTFKFTFEFVSMSEFGENAELIETAFDAPDFLHAVTPIGIDIEEKTAYAVGGDVTIKATYRGTNNPYAGFDDAADYVIRSATADIGVTVAVKSAANAALGEYTLTIKNGTPADLTGSVDLQAFTVANDVITHISNIIKISL